MTLEPILKNRLDELNAQKDSQLAQIRELQTELSNKIKRIPRRPRESLKELDEKAKTLEHERTVTSIALAEERQILKEIKGITRLKKEVEEYDAKEVEINLLKGKLDLLRDELSDLFSGVDEIQAALGKVRLAKKLECETDEITSKEMACPLNKIGNVIGKNGSMVKQIQESCKVLIDFENVAAKLTITGSVSSIERAVKEIERIILTVEEVLSVDQTMSVYLTTKHVHLVQQLRDEYTDSYVEMDRNSGGKISIRGQPDVVEGIKEKILGLKLVSKEKRLTGREGNLLVGKKGVTIDALCSEHAVSIEVTRCDDGDSIASFVGPPHAVEAVLSDVETLLNDNKERIEVVAGISSILRSVLLADGGQHVKTIKAKVVESIQDTNFSLYVDNSDRDNPELVLKAKQLVITDALATAVSSLKEVEKLVVKCTIDPFIAPRIIGKGGENIKKITEGKPVFFEINKTTGEAFYGATSVEVLDEFRKEVEEVIDSSSILRIDSDPGILKKQMRQLYRVELRKKLNELGCRLDSDLTKSCFVLIGKREDIEKGKVFVDEFLKNNQFREVPITDEDRNALLVGGKMNKITELSQEATDVDMQIDRANFCVTLRGAQEKINEMAEKLNQYLNGGNGYDVARLVVNEQVVGKIIGKGGSTRKELEAKYDGVSINISRTHVVTIRGPSDAVSDCRVEIVKMVASARVNQSIPITEEQKESLDKAQYPKKIYSQMPVSVAIKNNMVTLWGTFHDVRDAVSLLNEILTGEYKTSIEFEAPQFAKVRNAARDPSHFQRMEAECGAKVQLDLTAGSISISGKRSNVKRAKDRVYSFCDFVLPNELKRLKISKPLFTSVGEATLLAEVSAGAGGVAICLDRDLSLIVIRSVDEEKVNTAVELMKEKIKEAERLVCVLEVDPSDSWLIPILIGKKGASITLMRSKHPDCKIDVSKDARTIAIIGQSEEAVQEIREDVLATIEKIRNENMFISIPEDTIAPFVGKKGSHIKEMSAKYEVDIQTVRKGSHNLKITGEASNVQNAKEAIYTWLGKREKSNATLAFTLERQNHIAAIIGQKGVVARALEADFKCKIDVDKKTLVVTIRGPDDEHRERALAKMKELIEAYRDEMTARQLEAMERKERGELSSSDDDVDEMQPAPTESKNLSEKLNGELESVVEKEDEKKSEFPVKPVGVSDVSPKSRNEYPTKPVGVSAMKPKNGKTNGKKVDPLSSDGTLAGNSLFAMLMSQD